MTRLDSAGKTRGNVLDFFRQGRIFILAVIVGVQVGIAHGGSYTLSPTQTSLDGFVQGGSSPTGSNSYYITVPKGKVATVRCTYDNQQTKLSTTAEKGSSSWKKNGSSCSMPVTLTSDATLSISASASPAVAYTDFYIDYYLNNGMPHYRHKYVYYTTYWYKVYYTISVSYSEAPYSVNYYLNGGKSTGSMPSSATPGSWFAVAAPVRMGCRFVGWKVVGGLSADTAKYSTVAGVVNGLSASTMCGGGANVCSFLNLTKTGSVTLSAMWAEDPSLRNYTVSYYLNGGIASGEMPSRASCGKWFSVPAPCRLGCRFKGWKVVGGLSTAYAQYSEKAGVAKSLTSPTTQCGSGLSSCSFADLSITGSAVLSAVWQEDPSVLNYSISYYLNGGEASASMPTSSRWGNWFSVPAPTRRDCRFMGWKVVGGLAAGYAQYSETPGVGRVISSSSVTCGGGRSSCSFANLTMTGSVVLSAIWQEEPLYSISYYYNGGSAVATMPSSARWGTWVEVSAPIRPGCRFKGWQIIGGLTDGSARYSTTPGYGYGIWSSTSTYGGYCKSCSFANLTAGRSVVLSAIWEEDPSLLNYTVSYSLGGGTISGQMPRSARWGEWIYVDNPTRAGSIFMGWKVTGDLAVGYAKYSTSPGVALTVSPLYACGYYSSPCCFANLTTSGRITLTAEWYSGAKTFSASLARVSPQTERSSQPKGEKTFGILYSANTGDAYGEFELLMPEWSDGASGYIYVHADQGEDEGPCEVVECGGELLLAFDGELWLADESMR